MNTINYNYKICKRNYPYENLMKKSSIKCKYNPFSYSLDFKNSQNKIDLHHIIMHAKRNGSFLFYTVIDDYSFVYLLNLYRIFIIPFDIRSLLVITFYKHTLKKCKKHNIVCVFKEWPDFIKNSSKINLRKKLWFLKYYYFYYIIKSNINILFIDSDVIFINNCLQNLIRRNEDIVLLKSQLPEKITFGNSGIVYYNHYFVHIEELNHQ